MVSAAKPLTSARRRSTHPEPTIAVWGHYHGGNLGDELVVDTIVDAIRRRVPGARIVAVSMAPADTRARHSIDAYPINAGTRAAHALASTGRSGQRQGRIAATAARSPVAGRLRTLAGPIRKLLLEPWFLWRSYRMLCGVDLVVVAGSGQLLDEWRGPWLHPYTTFRWALLARLAKVPMVYPSVGAGPIKSRLSAFFIRTALASAAYVSVRDDHSGRVLAAIGSARAFSVCPDMGYGLPARLLREAATADAEGNLVVGLNVMAHQDPRYWPRGDVRRYEAFLEKMAAFACSLIDEGHTVCLFSSQPRSDGRVADDLIRLIAENGPFDPSRLQSAMKEIEQVRDLVGVIAGCDAIVAARYHSVLLPLLMDIPVVGLAYNAKTTELLAGVGQPERSLDIDTFSVDDLVGAFRDLCRPEDPEARDNRRARVAGHRAAVEGQFARIFGSANVPSRKAYTRRT